LRLLHVTGARHVVAVLLQEAVDGVPAGLVHESAVDENDIVDS
jgi:hypothetical protein